MWKAPPQAATRKRQQRLGKDGINKKPAKKLDRDGALANQESISPCLFVLYLVHVLAETLAKKRKGNRGGSKTEWQREKEVKDLFFFLESQWHKEVVPVLWTYMMKMQHRWHGSPWQ